MTTSVILSLIALAISIVTTFCKFAYDYSRLSTRMSNLEKSFEQGQKQLGELYQSRLDTNSRIATLIESSNSLEKRLDRFETKIENKIDLLLQKRGDL